MCPIVDGTPVNAANTNAQKLDKVSNDTATGIISLANTTSPSGTSVTNVQRDHNALWSFIGGLINSVKDILPSWTNNNFGTSTDPLKTKIEAIDAAFNPTTGQFTYRAGVVNITNGNDFVNITFSSAWPDTLYKETWSFYNLVDASPIFLQGIVTSRSTTGFTITFNAPADSSNYFVTFAVRKPL